MTSLTLLLWIALGIGLQIAVYLGIGFWRHWRGYQDLRSRVTDLPEPPAAPPAAEAAGVPAWTGYRNFRVARKEIEDAALSVCSFYLVPEDGQPLPPFLPGQFLTFRLDLPTAAGGTEALVRCYSLSDGPRADYYRVSVKRVPAPPGSGLAAGRSSNFFHDRVTVGSVLPVRAPAGHFHIDRSDAPAVLIGGGIGITPLLSMLDACLATQPQREFWLFYGVRHGGELVMAEHLAALAEAHANFHLRLCFSAPRPSDVDGREERRHGRIDVRLLRQELPLKPYHFYLCGPGPMMESLVPALEDWGVPAAHIHYEAFGPASIKRRPAAVPAAAPADAGIVVGFARSGKELAWQPAAGSLLEFAEASGIAVNSGCRAGGCGSCQTTIKSGEVAYRQPPDFDPEPGTCLLCVCTPKTSITLEA
ncbi:MAG: 2Fe-2S iron-sulfur cluster binding domain-containing protein [Rhodocyclales bacterium]|nr:2Fe-2S iron-sulfur cluster binding domain-containing protein [Rhodocyclales bacterium]